MKYKGLQILIVLLFFCLNLFGQDISKKVEFENIRPYSKVRIDTVVKELAFNKVGDNYFQVTYTSYFNKEEYQAKYEFELGQEPKAYRLKTVSDDDFMSDSTLMKCIETKEIELKGEKYIIHKFFYDLESGEDEENLIFFTEQFGIIMEKPISWPVYSRLINSSEIEEERILNKLCEFILYDSSFFRNYKSKK